ncbi:flavin-binding monooxygenase [Fusarium subglutinans]|uniref:Flavin-binding monooxygenase n=1 Tax=Gibberella subglutinans TaxID=42677 RepID=A0A8H5QEI6_GIBSU|nr:flavin-binding monooxygenase [Fusarium subglutinans]KAF5613794.1 flavin-binding monooxygenase [Fusarium subglutinans]
MEHPVKEIGGVIKSLTQGSPDVQESTLREYFLPNASFSHPYCRVPSISKGQIPLAGGLESIQLILAIYRWYRTLSPHIDLKVDSAAFDQKSGLLYVSIRQTFALWFIPLYKAPVKLVSVLQLTQLSPESSSEDEGSEDSKPRRQNPRYYIASQEDLYPVNDCIQFLCPGLGPFLWTIWQLYSTWLCVIGSLLFLPVYFLLNGTPSKTKKKLPKF